jgi:hypothetical protein
MNLHHIATWLAGLICVPLAHAACGELYPCEQRPSGIGAIAKVTIERNWERTSVAPEESWNCNKLQSLKVADVRRYLRLAGRITHNAMQYVTSDSVCAAYGSLTTRSGRKATWRIGIWTEAQLQWSDLADDAESTYLYCRRCRAPFEPL